MIKALMLVTSISLGDVETVLPNMEDCLNARQSIIEQQADAKVLCVPYSQEQTKSDEMRDMFSAFMEMIIQLRSYEENYGNLGEENRQYCRDVYYRVYNRLCYGIRWEFSQSIKPKRNCILWLW
jgi:hypothetical protein